MPRKRRSRPGRNVDGILLLDKPAGASSNDALQEVKRLFGAAKAGHTGSLDPLATGVLPLCFGEATKFSQYLLDADKGYEAEILLGIRTETGDADGEVVETRPVPELDEARVDAALDAFRGPIEQIPSMYSAIKHQGTPLYKLARQGIEVEREPRPVTIHENTLLSIDGPRLRLSIRCTKGTYIRTIAEDLGEALGCGAHVVGLRRTLAGPFTLEGTHTIAELEAIRSEGGHAALDALLSPVECSVQHWPSVRLKDPASYYLCRGQPVVVSRAPTEGWVQIHEDLADGGSRFLGVGEVLDDGRIAPRRLVV